MPDPSSSALWQTVAKLLLHRIRSGKYAIGEVLPREIDLAEELKVSRNTVREAMRVLAADGLVQRRKRIGTIVVRAEKEKPRSFILDPLQSLEYLHRSMTARVRKRPRTPLPEAVTRAFPGADPGKWVRITLVRHAKDDGEPVSSTEIYLHRRLDGMAARIEPGSYSVFRLIEQVTGERVKRIDTVVSPCQLSAEQAVELGAVTGGLGLLVSRRVINEANELIEVAETTLPAGRFELEFSCDIQEADAPPVAPSSSRALQAAGRR
jgi:DNA-binding GntR family transcriptional regulator